MSTQHAPERDAAVRKVISKRELLESIPLSYPTIWQMMRRSEFPCSIKIGAKVGWFLDEVTDWLARRERSQFKPPAEAEARRRGLLDADDGHLANSGDSDRVG